MKVGNPRFSGQQKNYFSIKDGEQKFRILPPLGDNADTGVWAEYYKVHYGYRDTQGKMQVFVSPEVMNNKTRMIEVNDAAKQRIASLKAQLEETKLSGDTNAAKALEETLDRFNLDGKWYMNAVSQDGQIGLLKIPHRAKQALDILIKEEMANGNNPLGLEGGLVFSFKRSGKGRDTLYSVSVATETFDVPGHGKFNRPMKSTVTLDTLTASSSQLSDLSKLFKTPSAEEVEQIVAGGPEAVDRILGGKGQKSLSVTSNATILTSPAPTPVSAPQAVTSGFVSTAPQGFSEAPYVAPVQTSTGFKSVTEAPAAAVRVGQAATPGLDFGKMSDDDFQKYLSQNG